MKCTCVVVLLFFCSFVVSEITVIINEMIPNMNLNQICVVSQDLSDQDMLTLTSFSQSSDLNLFVDNDPSNLGEKCRLTENGLIILKNLKLSSVKRTIFDASQRHLARNVWIVLNTKQGIADSYFTSNPRRFGIQVSIIFMNSIHNNISVSQALGTATTKVDILHHGTYNIIKFKKLINDAKAVKNFNGLEFKVNFGDFPPYCIIANDSVSGVFLDSIKIVASLLNLTLIVKNPLPENHGIWAMK
jgi:hypothetical protein